MANIVGYFCGYPIVLAEHLKAAALSANGDRRIWPLPQVRYSMHAAEELGNKCCATLALLDHRKTVVPVSLDEWHGINAMERDDQL